MSVLDIEGFESRSTAIFDLNQDASFSTTDTRGYWSGACLAIGAPGATPERSFSPRSEIWHGFGHKTQQGGANEFISWVSTDGFRQAYLVRTNTGYIEARRGDGALLGTSNRPLAVDRWYWIDVHLKISPTSGIFEVWIDEVQEISFSGNTRGATNDLIGSRRWRSTNAAGLVMFDDDHIYDTAGTEFNGRVGDRGIAALTVVADGDVIQLSRFGAGLTNNYQAVDELPPNDATDYVYSQTLNAYDLYQLSDSLVELTDIGPVKIQVRAQKKDPGVGQVAAVLKYDSNGDGC